MQGALRSVPLQLNTSTGAHQRVLCVTPPQLTDANLVAASSDAAASSVYALLSNSDVHVWDTPHDQPAMLRVAWTHMRQEGCCSIATLLAASPCFPGHDHLLLLGTRHGEVLFCDIHSGRVLMQLAVLP
jgi:hypothetical protein